jgi:hypothetical protein
MPLKAGTINDLTDSMAQTMIDTFNNEWESVMGKDTPKPQNMDQMNLLFTAVAQGVVQHLQKHPTDFIVTVTDSGTGTDTGTVTSIL